MVEELSHDRLEELYLPPTDDFVFVDVPEMLYFMIDGAGDPDDGPHAEAVRWLFAAVYPIKRAAKQRMGRKFVEPPLEGLWWTDDPADFAAGRRDRLQWRMMIPAPPWATDAMFAEAIAEAAERRGEPPESLRLGRCDEGRCAQIMVVGPYAEQAATIARRLHEEFLPAHGLIPAGPHHEIYLNDVRRTDPAKHKTVMRQPVRACPTRSGA